MQQGFLGTILSGYSDIHGSLVRQLDGGLGEERILAYAAYVSLIAGVAQLPGSVRSVAQTGQADSFGAVVIGGFVATLFFAPLFLYGLAALSHLLAKPFGAKGTFFTARAGFFWSLVLASPLMLINSLALAILFTFGRDMPAAIGPYLGLTVFGIWLWIWAACLEVAESFSNQRKIFAVTILSVGVLIAVFRIINP
ncbi:MAG TPA: hypothetical protein VLA51_11865 [Paracoccaceae bacterium]|nr:hypothetical protein [Paracoccaceae bacterium]